MSSNKPAPENRGNRKGRNTGEAPAASVNMDELRELIALVRDNGLAEFELERSDFRVRLVREGAGTHYVAPPAPAPAPVAKSAPPVAAPAHPGAQSESAASEDQDLRIVKSPIVGTFYRSPSPTAEPFVKIGSRIEVEAVVCIIEAMKLMNEIQSEFSGEVVKVYVENGQPVEYGQPLFGIRS
jgi:acetyl-CoA carboxylase biotin carboxyl carrier protein